MWKFLGIIVSYLVFLFVGIPAILCFITGDLIYLGDILWLMFKDVINFLIELVEWSVIIFAVWLGIRLA